MFLTFFQFTSNSSLLMSLVFDYFIFFHNKKSPTCLGDTLKSAEIIDPFQNIDYRQKTEDQRLAPDARFTSVGSK